MKQVRDHKNLTAEKPAIFIFDKSRTSRGRGHIGTRNDPQQIAHVLG